MASHSSILLKNQTEINNRVMKTLYNTEIESSKLEDIGTGQQRMAKGRFDNANIEYGMSKS